MGCARRVLVETVPPYEVRIGTDLLGELATVTAGHARCAVVTDERVAELYLERLGAPAHGPVFRLPPGERSKRLGVLESLLEFLAEAGLDRGSCLVLLGGGVVGDLGGLAASLYMRGITAYQVPTTLLAQVDASVGGKTAVDLAAGKNLAGTVHQPRGVWADVDTLATLSATEYASGLGEVAKTALLDGELALARLEGRAAALRARDRAALVEVVADCTGYKAGVVARDPEESGLRKTLNLGHTFAHAIERAAGYGAVPHGVAVAVGLSLGLELARRAGRLEDPELPARAGRLLAALGLPEGLGGLRRATGAGLAPVELVAAMALDKKGRAGGPPRFVLLSRAGAPRVDVEVEREHLLEVLGSD